MTTNVIVQPRITKITRIDGRVTRLVRSIAVSVDGGGVSQAYVDNGDAATLVSANAYTDSSLSDKADLVGGFVPASQLPSFVDDVLEGHLIDMTTFDDLFNDPYVPESGKIYLDITTNLQYRWGGSSYVVLNPSLALGETSSTAYRGDRGKIAYDHSQATGNPHGTSFSDLLNQSALFNLVYSAYVIGSNVGILATDTLGEMLGKLQAQVNAKLDANANAVSATKLVTARNINGVAFDGTANITIVDSTKEPAITADLVTKFWSGTKTFRDLATDVRDVVLTGLSTSTATAVTATDKLLVGIGKLQAQVSINTSNSTPVPKKIGSSWYLTGLYHDACYPFNSNTITTLTQTVGQQIFIPVTILENTTIASLACNVTTIASAGGVVQLGIYFSDSNNEPSTLQFKSSNLDTTALGVKTATCSVAVTAGQIIYLSMLSLVAASAMTAIGAVNLRTTRGSISLGSGHSAWSYVSSVSDMPSAPATRTYNPAVNVARLVFTV